MSMTAMPRLISQAYREEQTALHQRHGDYGVASVAIAPIVARIVQRMSPGTILDYGAGKQRLGPALETLLASVPPIRSYEPAIAELSSPPEPADLVVCLDVLEHVEPDCVDAVIEDLARVARRHLFASIASGPSRRMLDDGRNAHLIQEPPEWWLPRLWPRFRIRALNELPGDRFWLLAAPRAEASTPATPHSPDRTDSSPRSAPA